MPLQLAKFSPSAVLARAKKRALAWHPDAVLVSMSFAPVVNGEVDVVGGGSFTLLFARPAGARLGPGARVGPQRVLVTTDTNGTRLEERQDQRAARGVADPDCPFEQAWKKMIASGVASDAPLSVRYEMSRRHGRGVWRADVEGQPELTRTLDGRACRVLQR